MGLRDLLRPLERWEPLDIAGNWLGAAAGVLVGNRTAKTVLSGTWLGHSLHPVLTDVPVGALTSATLLDLLGGAEGGDAADALTIIGLAAVAPTALAGLSDWSDTHGQDRRLGVVHALANAGSSALYAAALLSRRGGNRRLGTAFSLAGLGVLGASGYIGGHLVFGRGIGVDHTVFDEPPSEWTTVARETDVPSGTPLRVEARGYGVLLYREPHAIHAIGDRCTHAGGPLHEGTVDAELCVTCPWHGSRFRLEDGAVVGGPATAPQPRFDVRLTDGNVEVRLNAD
jgi:nitrite reductase/ring-hydroxylating ferredoxin subunit/uncharacterized membrane protein